MTSARSYSILITDDDPASRETFRDIFDLQGFHTLVAECGEQAIDIVRANDVHLALMDMHMPKLSGLETMELVRGIRSGLPMILITADQDEHLLRKALLAQAYCVLSKPVSRHVVIHVVTRALTKFY